MRSIAKVAAGIAGSFVLFVVAVFVDIDIRCRYRGHMSIDGLPINDVCVRGSWIPDFLWQGKAWTINVDSEQPLELRLDGRAYFIPAGSHRIYSNHDHTNTGLFGNREFWGYPEKVEVRAGPPGFPPARE